jgi:hypothetical protein
VQVKCNHDSGVRFLLWINPEAGRDGCGTHVMRGAVFPRAAPETVVLSYLPIFLKLPFLAPNVASSKAHRGRLIGSLVRLIFLVLN